MEDFFADLYDDDKRDDGEEPSFSLYEFKKWLSRHKKINEEKISEGVRRNKKEKLKNELKKRISDKVYKRRKKED